MLFKPAISLVVYCRPRQRSRLAVGPGSSYYGTLCHLRFDSLTGPIQTTYIEIFQIQTTLMLIFISSQQR